MAFFAKKEAAPPANAVAEEIKAKTATEIATADVSELVNNMTKSCYDLCFADPGDATTSTEKTCTKNCAQKFMAAWNTTSQEYVKRLQS